MNSRYSINSKSFPINCSHISFLPTCNNCAEFISDCISFFSQNPINGFVLISRQCTRSILVNCNATLFKNNMIKKYRIFLSRRYFFVRFRRRKTFIYIFYIFVYWSVRFVTFSCKRISMGHTCAAYSRRKMEILYRPFHRYYLYANARDSHNRIRA